MKKVSVKEFDVVTALHNLLRETFVEAQKSWLIWFQFLIPNLYEKLIRGTLGLINCGVKLSMLLKLNTLVLQKLFGQFHKCILQLNVSKNPDRKYSATAAALMIPLSVKDVEGSALR